MKERSKICIALMPFLFLFLALSLALTSIASAEYITPDKYQVNECVHNYFQDDRPNSYELACEVGNYFAENYAWNVDIRQVNFSNHAPVYINVFYPANDNIKGYSAYYAWLGYQSKEVTCFWDSDKRMYYTNWYNPGNTCYIPCVQSYGIIKSYFGNVDNLTDNCTVPEDEIEEQEENNTTVIEDNITNETVIDLITDNETVNDTVELNTTDTTPVNNTTNLIVLKDIQVTSTNTVKNTGMIDSIKQYIIDLSGANWSNVSFNIWS